MVEKSGMFYLTSTFMILTLNESGIHIKALNKTDEQDDYLKADWSQIHSIEAVHDPH